MFVFLFFGIHILTFIVHYHWSLNVHSDTVLFYENAKNASNRIDLYGIGNKSIPFLIYPLVKIGVGYMGISSIFTMLSVISYKVYFNLITSYTSFYKSKSIKLLTAFFFTIPSLHFWTVSITKEAVLFAFFVFIFYNILKDKFFHATTIICLFIITIIRPYIGFFILLSFIITFFLKVKRTKKIALALSLCVGVVIMLKFLNLESISDLSVNFHYLAEYAKNNGHSSIDLLNSSYIERLLLVLFRPFFFDTKNLMQIIVSFENLSYVLVFLILFKNIKFLKQLILRKAAFRYLVLFIFLVVLFYSTYMYNLGLASRMRVMYIPAVLLLLIFTIDMNRKQKRVS